MAADSENGRTRYELLNRMLASRAVGNQKKTEEAFRTYLEQENMSKRCFSLMEFDMPGGKKNGTKEFDTGL